MSAEQGRSGGRSRQAGLEDKALKADEDKSKLVAEAPDGSEKQFAEGEVADGTDGVPVKAGGVEVVMSHFIDGLKPGDKVTVPAVKAVQYVDGHYARRVDEG